jgi:hypothetical protein
MLGIGFPLNSWSDTILTYSRCTSISSSNSLMSEYVCVRRSRWRCAWLSLYIDGVVSGLSTIFGGRNGEVNRRPAPVTLLALMRSATDSGIGDGVAHWVKSGLGFVGSSDCLTPRNVLTLDRYVERWVAVGTGSPKLRCPVRFGCWWRSGGRRIIGTATTGGAAGSGVSEAAGTNAGSGGRVAMLLCDRPDKTPSLTRAITALCDAVGS